MRPRTRASNNHSRLTPNPAMWRLSPTILVADLLLPPSPPSNKTSASEDQAGQPCTCYGAGDTTGDRRIVVGLKAATTAIIQVAQDKLGNCLPRASMDIEI